MIAKQLTKQEIDASPEAQAAVRAEYDKLRNQDELGTWLENTVHEKSDVMKEARRLGKKGPLREDLPPLPPQAR